MKHILKIFKKSIFSILFIIGLLITQAICDLSLPQFTSNIINIGVQQGGIENSNIKVIRESTMNDLLLFVKQEEQGKILNQYELLEKKDYSDKEWEKLIKKYPLLKEEALYQLKKVDKEVDNALSLPMFYELLFASKEEEYVKIQQQIINSLPNSENMQNVGLMSIIKMMDQKAREQFLNAILEKLNEMPESLISQQAVNFVKQEYIAIGINTDKLQTNYIFVSGLTMLAIALISMATTIGVGFLGSRVAARFARITREQIYDKVLHFSTAEMKQFGVASLVTRSTNDIQQVQMMLVFTLRIIFYAPIIGVGGVIKAMGANSSMAWIIAVAVLAVFSLVILLFALVMPKFKKVQSLIDRVNLVMREIISGIPVVRAFSNQRHEEKRFDDASIALKKTLLFVDRVMACMMPSMMFIMNGVAILIVWQASHSIDQGLMQVGDMLAFIQYTMQIIMSFLMISMSSVMLPRAGVSVGRIAEVLNTTNSVVDPIEEKPFDENKKGEVEFRNVSFCYPDSDANTLSDISFVAKSGETTAFIGSTGSGKSTLINLIPRFFDVTKGEILVSGVPIKEVKQEKLHQKIGYVPQRGVLFSGTIASNIKYGDDTISDDEMRKAAKIAQSLDFIEAKEEGFSSPIAQGGTNVSGGQKQRLSIARAIALNPEIYIFDDSFSALDFKTDKALRQALEKYTKGATILIVAQRISTIMNADQIIVLDEGKIVGKGTHKELLKNCSVYYEIASSQLSKEELEHE